jgi:hypothetical protein
MSPSGFAGVALISASLLLLALGNAGPNAMPASRCSGSPQPGS